MTVPSGTTKEKCESGSSPANSSSDTDVTPLNANTRQHHDVDFVAASQDEHSGSPPTTTNSSASSEGARRPPPVVSAATLEYHRSPTLIRAISTRYPTPLPIHLRCVAHLLLLLLPSLFYVGPLMIVLPPFLYVYSPQCSLCLLIIDVVLMFYPLREWKCIRSVFELFYTVFDFHHNIRTINPPPGGSNEDDEDHNNSNNDNQRRQREQSHFQPSSLFTETQTKSLCICAMHPHGVVPVHSFLWVAFCNQYFPEDMYGFGATADAALRIPLLRQVLGWTAANSASRHVVVPRMMKGGKNLYVLPGGVAEVFLAKPGTHAIKAKRRGLMRVALQTGAALVPVYVFGGNDFFHHVATSDVTSLFREWTRKKKKKKGGGRGEGRQNQEHDSQETERQKHKFTERMDSNLEKISRKARAGFTVFWGQYGLPMPYKVKCCMVLGDPIVPLRGSKLGEDKLQCEDGSTKLTCRRTPNPTEEQIDDLLERYTDALRRLFDQYKAQAGCPYAHLEIH